MSNDANVATALSNIAALLSYAEKKLYMPFADKVYIQNQIFDLLKIEGMLPSEFEEKDVYQITTELFAFAVSKGIYELADQGLFLSKICGMITPMPSKIIEIFDDIAATSNSEKACKFLYELSQNNTYLNMPQINRNIVWEYKNDVGNILISINLAKPEKTPAEVARAKLITSSYPLCPLCYENLGFAGNSAKPGRQNLRSIPIFLNDEEWLFQYSPYVYFTEHLIAFSKEHRPMNIDKTTFLRLLDFVKLFPHYFIGSNAALPIVGGSILAHEHYQGGAKVLPIFKQKGKNFFTSSKYPNVNISIVNWHNSVIRLSSKDTAQLLSAVEDFYTAWNDYKNEELEIIPFTMNSEEKIPHNAVNPICLKNDDDEYEFLLILRNNRTNDKYKFGIFHPHESLHNIKQEAIGLIEAQGLFILPGRLNFELNEIKDLLTSSKKLDFKKLADEKDPLHKHLSVIAQLAQNHGTQLSAEEAGEIITNYVNEACKKILETTAVFKKDEKSQSEFVKFIESVI